MNSIHPTAIVGENVVLGTGNTIGPYVVITGPTAIGNDNWVGAGVIIGAPPEVRSWQHPRDAMAPDSGSGVVIGDRNVLREHVQVHSGWKDRTVVGNDCFVMNQSYLAHDVELGSEVTLAAGVLLAGHVTVADAANLGLGVRVHQGRALGAFAMLGMGAVVVDDIPPFVMAYGNPARVKGLNLVGMRRRNIPEDVIDELAASSPPDWDDVVINRLASAADVGPAFASWLARRAG